LPDARLLTIAQREKVVQYGLGDRESSVRKASAAMLAGWVDQVDGDLVEVSSAEHREQDRAERQFLNRFDVLSSEAAEDALASVFVTRPEVYKAITFNGMY
jgi:condensin complex subunit 3